MIPFFSFGCVPEKVPFPEPDCEITSWYTDADAKLVDAILILGGFSTGSLSFSTPDLIHVFEGTGRDDLDSDSVTEILFGSYRQNSVAGVAQLIFG
jgi:hypothetical protein